MRLINVMRLTAAHICTICSVAYLITRILDWYNPYMNFSGQTLFIQYLLGIGAFMLGVLQIIVRKK